jgi:hypothetical protein
VEISQEEGARLVTMNVLNGKIDISKIILKGFGTISLKKTDSIQPGIKVSYKIKEKI